MGTAMLATIGIYIYEMDLIFSQKWYVRRGFLEVTETVDFEEITAAKDVYFLYKDPASDAVDATGGNGFVQIDSKMPKTCGGDDKFGWNYDLKRITRLRDNMTSYYMMFSEILILIQMFICFVVACIWIPFSMNEYQIPI